MYSNLIVAGVKCNPFKSVLQLKLELCELDILGRAKVYIGWQCDYNMTNQLRNILNAYQAAGHKP